MLGYMVLFIYLCKRKLNQSLLNQIIMANNINIEIISKLEQYEEALINAKTFWELNGIYANLIRFIYQIELNISKDKDSYNQMIKTLQTFEICLNSLPKPNLIE